MLDTYINLAILCAVVSLGFTVKNGFNEVIAGLQSIYDQTDRSRRD